MLGGWPHFGKGPSVLLSIADNDTFSWLDVHGNWWNAIHRLFPYLCTSVTLHNNQIYPEKNVHTMDACSVICQSMGKRHGFSLQGRSMGGMQTGSGHARWQR